MVAPKPNGHVSLRTMGIAASGGLEVDAEAGVIHGVSLMTEGPATGHGFYCDAVLLQQVVTFINARPDGVRVRITHPEKKGADGAMFLVGKIKNARVEGDQARGDLHLGAYAAKSPHGDLRSYILAIAEEDPALIGLSVVFAPDVYDTKSINGTPVPVARAMDVVAVDLTDYPAANPAGMLSGVARGDHVMLSNLSEKMQTLLGERAVNEESRTDLIFALASASGIDGWTMEYLLEEGAAHPSMDTLKAWATILGVEVEVLQVAAEADGCVFAAEEVAEATSESSETPAEAEEEPAAALSAGSVTPAAAVALSAADKKTANVPSGVGGNGTNGAASAEEPAAVAAARAAGDEQARNRFVALSGLAEQVGLTQEWATDHFKRGTSLNDAKDDAMAKLAKDRQPVQLTGGNDLNLDTLGPAVRDAIMLRANEGRPLIEHDERGLVMLSADGRPQHRQPVERSRQFRNRSMIEIARVYLTALGIDHDGMSRIQVAKTLFNPARIAQLTGNLRFLAQGSSDFPAILEDIIGRTLRQGYTEATPTWSLVFRETSHPDFRQISRTQVSGVSTPPRVREGQEYGYTTLGDAKEVYALGKYGEIILITWEAIVNDDKDAFGRIPRNQARACARLEDDLAWVQITSNPTMGDGTALFDADHANLDTAADITVLSMGTGRALMRKQTGLKGEKLSLRPEHLIVPVTQETKAQQLSASTVDPSKSNATPNPFQNVNVVSEPRLDEDSTTKWYQAANVDDVDTVEVCFLEGERQPALDQEDGFMVDGRKWKVRHVCAAKVIDHRGLVCNPWGG